MREFTIQGLIEELLEEIRDKSWLTDCIYRGEPQLFEEQPYDGKVSSSLWRVYCKYDGEFNIETIQQRLIRQSKIHAGILKYGHSANPERWSGWAAINQNIIRDLEILLELQHYGGKTNLIDFTEEYLIALFFACNSDPDTDGRVIVLPKSQVEDITIYPEKPKNRVIAQKSVFIRPVDGFIVPSTESIVTIPFYMKRELLKYLSKYHSISAETMYNDFHGFIRNQNGYLELYALFHRANNRRILGTESKNPKDKLRRYKEAISYYDEAIELKPDFNEPYLRRSGIYIDIYDVDKDSENLDKAMDDVIDSLYIDPSESNSFNVRGFIFHKKGDVNSAINDYKIAIRKNKKNKYAYTNLGRAYIEEGHLNHSIENCNKAIEIDSNFIYAYIVRGMAFLALGQWQRASADLDPTNLMSKNGDHFDVDDIKLIFIETYSSISEFEEKFNRELPENLLKLLT